MFKPDRIWFKQNFALEEAMVFITFGNKAKVGVIASY